MKRTRSITLVSFAATVLASCDAAPTVEQCLSASTAGPPPAACERVLEANEAAFVTGGGIQPDADQCYAFATQDSYPQSCERFVNRSSGTIASSSGHSRPWIFIDSSSYRPPSANSWWWSSKPKPASAGTALTSRGWLKPAARPSVSSDLRSTTSISRPAPTAPRASAPSPAPRSFSIFSSSRGGFGSSIGSGGG